MLHKLLAPDMEAPDAIVEAVPEGDFVRTTKREIILGMLVYCALASTVMAEKPKVLSDNKINRHALVNRHNITINKPAPLTPLSVGNGEFAFTARISLAG